MSIKSYSLQDIARYAAIYTLQTTIGDGSHEVFVDSVQIPASSFGVLWGLSQGHPSNTSENCGAFVCRADMGPGTSPLLPNGQLDPNKIGPCIYEDASNVQNISSQFLQPNYIPLPSGWFIRFSSYLRPTSTPGAGEFYTWRMGLSIIPICDC